MIQNINFPEGTSVVYQKGSVYDQFNANIEITPTLAVNITAANGLYSQSQLYSARKLKGSYENAFSSANCYYKIKETIDLDHTFHNGQYPYDLILDKNIPVTGWYVLNGATINNFITISGNFTNIQYMLDGYKSSPLYVTWDVDTSNLTNITSFLGAYTAAVYGNVSVKSIGNMNQYYIGGYTRSQYLRQLTLIDIGYNPSQTSVNFSYFEVWGINTIPIPDARKSLIDSLITYSFDRATAGYSTCTIKLAPKTKALLTEEEIAQITAKGYTIS